MTKTCNSYVNYRGNKVPAQGKASLGYVGSASAKISPDGQVVEKLGVNLEGPRTQGGSAKTFATPQIKRKR